MSALDEARKEKVMNAMEHTKAFIAAVAEFDADRVRAAAEVRPRPHPSSPTLADFFSPTTSSHPSRARVLSRC